MADVLNMQDANPDEAPREEKGSHVSWGFCRNSYKSWGFCAVV